MDALPKYIQNANKVIARIAHEPDQTWNRTQRELGAELGLSQPELSNIARILRDSGHIKHGHTLTGRGKVRALVLTDDTPLSATPPRSVPAEDRKMSPEEAMPGAWNLQELTLEQVGLAVMRMINHAHDTEERHLKTKSELNERISQYRDRLTEERNLRIRMGQEIDQLRAELNKYTATRGAVA